MQITNIQSSQFVNRNYMAKKKKIKNNRQTYKLSITRYIYS